MEQSFGQTGNDLLNNTMTEKTSNPPRPVVLCILDGWGYRESTKDNAIAMAATPNYDQIIRDYPHALLETSGAAVGLPKGQMGNSEVGHMNIGGGRIVKQSLPRIDEAIADGSFSANATLATFLEHLKNAAGTCHLLGLASPGGVHSHQDHFVALASILTGAGIPVAIHAFLDGRDTPPKSARAYLADLEQDMAGFQNTSIATVSGRYYAMDRDQRWQRTGLAYEALVNASGVMAPSVGEAIGKSYDAGVGDEFMLPSIIGDFKGMKDGDGLIIINFRADRVRQLALALAAPGFEDFERTRSVAFSCLLGMTEYSSKLKEFYESLFPPMEIKDNMGVIVARAGLKQLRIAETEKYAHVTFFFNGGDETIFEGEDRKLIPSPKVATYDLQPEMSAPEVTDELVAALSSDKYDFIVVNYANADMVGHTGNMAAARKAVEMIDICLGRLQDAVISADGVLLITADHGNIELMSDQKTAEPYTAHTNFEVPVHLVNYKIQGKSEIGLKNGQLADVAPTLLDIMGLEQPEAMTGRSLLSVSECK